MRYSVRGAITTEDGQQINAVINQYQLWRLITQAGSGMALFEFEAWVDNVTDKSTLFDDLKPFVDTHGGWIDWHECTHDELTPTPCVIIETYTQGG